MNRVRSCLPQSEGKVSAMKERLEKSSRFILEKTKKEQFPDFSVQTAEIICESE